MVLVGVLLTLVAVVSLMLVCGTLLCIDREQLRQTRRELRPRLILVAPSIALLATVLILNSLTRRAAQSFSWLIGFNITNDIYRVEGDFVPWLQTFATHELTVYFSFIYLFGYVFLLVFPLLAYLALSDQRTLHELTIAYAANYGLGLLCYVIFIAYGPRNMDIAAQLMYDFYPQSQFLTSAVNVNTNVFPSLHTSLSATVMIFAWHTREQYPRWFLLAQVIGASVIVSTMYLGIHWLIDVIAGIVLAYASVLIGQRYADDWRELTSVAPATLARQVRHRF